MIFLRLPAPILLLRKRFAEDGWAEGFAFIAGFRRPVTLRILQMLDLCRGELTPILLDKLSQAVRNLEEDDDEDDTLAWVIFTLGDWEERRALPLLLDLLRLPRETIDYLLGDLMLRKSAVTTRARAARGKNIKSVVGKRRNERCLPRPVGAPPAS